MNKFLVFLALLFLLVSIILFFNGFTKTAMIFGGLVLVYIYQLIEHTTMGKTHDYLFEKHKDSRFK